MFNVVNHRIYFAFKKCLYFFQSHCFYKYSIYSNIAILVKFTIYICCNIIVYIYKHGNRFCFSEQFYQFKNNSLWQHRYFSPIYRNIFAIETIQICPVNSFISGSYTRIVFYQWTHECGMSPLKNNIQRQFKIIFWMNHYFHAFNSIRLVFQLFFPRFMHVKKEIHTFKQFNRIFT